MTADDGKYVVVGIEKFHQDLLFLRQQAKASPVGYRQLYREVLREIERLRTGTTDGHHALGYEPGKGDLRDCVTTYVKSDPARKADYRLVFREIGPRRPGEKPQRELLAIKPRHGRNNIYAHVCARLGRHAADLQPGLGRFGERRPDARGSQALRQAELEAKRAIAHAWAGQRPLRSTRPLVTTARSPVAGPASRVTMNADRTGWSSTLPGRSRSEPTGWPQCGR